MIKDSTYYVYVYIDPRDFTEFYYGKGKGSRKSAHLSQEGDTDKLKTIKEIQSAGLKPIIRVIAKDLTEADAFLIEKTLIWKLGKTLTNISSGAFSEKFRPQKTMYKEIFGFDYSNGVFFFNCGDDGKNERKWEDFKVHSFITAGGGRIYSDAIKSFEPGDIACVYLSGQGYVGVARILTKAVSYRDFKINGIPMAAIPTIGKYQFSGVDDEKDEFMCQVQWVAAVDRGQAYLERKGKEKMYTPQLVRASMEKQGYTIEKLSSHFSVNIMEILSNESGV